MMKKGKTVWLSAEGPPIPKSASTGMPRVVPPDLRSCLDSDVNHVSTWCIASLVAAYPLGREPVVTKCRLVGLM